MHGSLPGRLKKRSDFLRVSKHARKFVAPGFVLLAAPGTDSGDVRLGFTVTRKMGNAVRRNRIRRRLREASRQAAPRTAAKGCDYVLIAREAAYGCAFEDLIRDMERAFRKMAAASATPATQDTR